MDRVSALKKHTENMRKLNAFALYLEKGESNVKTMFPEYLGFVKSNKGKTKQQVSHELNLVTA